jgi:hypothetical protein
MIVPQYWAEARLQHREEKRQFTVRRFGWSDASQHEAQTLADSRAREALQRIVSGEKLPRREPKVAYNGAEGVPIREEILSRHGAAVVTRNLYGAQCLNTPDVLFADIDFDEGEVPPRLTCLLMSIGLVIAGWIGWSAESFKKGLLVAIGGLLLGAFLSTVFHRAALFLAGGMEKHARRRLAAFLARNPDWRVRLYRTPAGFRILALHRTFDPLEPAVGEFFRAIGTDRVYARMCSNQRCFRARVSPKPWRIGIAAHLRPRPGVWPIKPEHLPARRACVESYERQSAGYAACQFLTDLGDGPTHEAVAAVQRLHDTVSRAESGLPMA